jgi:hypothetical protein
MADVLTGTDEKIYKIQKWMGLNESENGDTQLKPGECAKMRNFRVTKDGSLQIRPGTKTMLMLTGGGVVRGLWHGYVNGTEHLLAASGGHAWDIDTSGWTFSSVGDIDDTETTFFGFSNKVYLLTGSGYYVWDGTNAVSEVAGYVPIVATATPPSGGGTLLESVNKLTGKKRQKFSPDGTSTVFQLTETEIDNVDSVTVDGAGKTVTTDYTVNLTAGTVTFVSVPAQGTNNVVIAWTKGTGDRSAVESMKYCELFNGITDTRVFLYGDGSNEALYSGVDHDGLPSAEYFPDLNVLDVGESNTPITGLIRHFSRLIAFKTNSTYSVQYSTITLDSGEVTAAFYGTPINRELGNIAPGQVRLLENNPWTLCENAVYEWKASSTYLTADERQAKRKSDRVRSTLSGFDLSSCVTFDDEWDNEYYIVCGSTALVYNYAADAWYGYLAFPAVCMISVDGEFYYGTADGKLVHVSEQYRNDSGTEIDAYCETGNMAFGRPWTRKQSPWLWISMKPESQARFTARIQTDRNRNSVEKEIYPAPVATFAHATFARWSFRTNRRPHIVRLKLKAKKYVYYKLILSSHSSVATGTVLAVNIPVRYTGNVR